jgi:NAD(P)-dependent dehydrogenase (short-subunit alcohol dehydrogenase family)
VQYLVTGATGFIGRHLVPLLLARGGEVHAVVREGSEARFEAMRARLGQDGERLSPVRGDVLHSRCGVGEADVERLRGGHLFHLAALYDLEADAEATELANVGGTAHALELAAAMEARCFHHLSSIAVSGDHRGEFGETVLDAGQSFDHPYFRSKFESERMVREAALPFRIYRPGIVIGSSETGEADRIDGPYYAFKLIQRLRDALPQWMPLVGPEGGPFPVVPVDFVARALDHIAHLHGEDGRTFHLVDPAPRSLGDTINTFCRAAHAPEFALRLDRRTIRAVPRGAVEALAQFPATRQAYRQVLRAFSIPEVAVRHMELSARFPATEAMRALEGSGIACPPLATYAWKVWDYWERRLDPELPTLENLRRAMAGKVVLVTGASSGIGRALAAVLATAGCVVVGVARDAAKLEEMRADVEERGGRASVHSADLSDPETCRRVVETVEGEQGRIDVLINNAGRSIRRSVAASSERFHDFDRTMRINYFGPVALILACLPGMRRRHSGHIINIASIGVQTYPPRFAAYVASKAALDAFSRCLSPEVAGDGVHVTTVCMPLVRTPMIAPTDIYRSFPTISAEDAAEMIVRALITRPHEVSTRLGKFGQLANAVSPGFHDLVMGAAFHVLPDSAVEREPDGTLKDRAAVSPEAYALGMLMRGIHL